MSETDYEPLRDWTCELCIGVHAVAVGKIVYKEDMSMSQQPVSWGPAEYMSEVTLTHTGINTRCHMQSAFPSAWGRDSVNPEKA